MTPRRRFLGFTLLECLIALAILAIALAAAARAASGVTDASLLLKRRLLAEWVAENRLNEHIARRAWPAVGSNAGSAEQARLSWEWRETVSETPNVNFRRIEIKVFAKDRPDYAAASLVGYLFKPENATGSAP